RFVDLAATRIGAEHGRGREPLGLQLFPLFTGTGHKVDKLVSSEEPAARTAAAAPASYLISRSSRTDTPRSSNRRRMVSSIRLLGQEAPAVMPTVIRPRGSQSRVSTSSALC